MSNSSGPRSYMVRANKQRDEDFDLLFENNVVAVGWSSTDFTSFDDVDDLVGEIEDRYHNDDDAPQWVGRKKNEVARFFSIRRHDRILVPFYSTVALAEAVGEAVYDPDVAESHDLSNQHRVNYLRAEDGSIALVPRHDLSEALQRRLRVRGSSVSDLSEFSDEIEALFEDPTTTWSTRVAEAEEEKRSTQAAALLSRIQEGETGLQAGGVGLEHIVRELLDLEGYEALITSTREYPRGTDADIKASRSDRFVDIELLVQVKHHRGFSGMWGAEQLDNIQELEEERRGTGLVLVTSARATEELHGYCRRKDIELVEGRELAEWILESSQDLCAESRTKLGLSTIPLLVDL